MSIIDEMKKKMAKKNSQLENQSEDALSPLNFNVSLPDQFKD